MPELPEVETIVRALQDGGRGSPPLPGRVVQEADLRWMRTLAAPDEAEFKARIRSQRIERVTRRGKFILIHLPGNVLLIHLRMSGDLRLEAQTDQRGAPLPPEPHDRLLLLFEDGWRLAFNDPRKFGRAWLTSNPREVLHGLGPEPFDESLDGEMFHRLLSERRRQLKPLLLDQSFLAGLGNIYTDEALHLARLHPLTLSSQLSASQAKHLLEAIRAVLQAGIRNNGASIDWVYRGGGFQTQFRAYGRTGQPCPACGTPIARTVIGQRGTHFCPTCQPLNAQGHIQPS